MSERKSHTKIAAGFTLLELLVSSAVLAIVLVILLGTMTTTLGLWRNTDNAIATDREGRSANLLLHDELSSAVVPSGKLGLWPRVDSNGTFLAFLTRKPADYQNSATGEVGEVVYVEYLVVSNALKRRMVGSRKTYASMLNGDLPTSDTTTDFQILATNIIPAALAMRRTLLGRTAADLAAIARPFVPVSRGWVRAGGNAINFTNRPDLAVGAIYQTNSKWYRIVGTSNSVTTNSSSGTVDTRVDALADLLVYNEFFIETPDGDLPQAIEVNLGATDMGTMANRDLFAADTNIIIRNPGFFHFRATLFPSP
jgi:prepilin-type N-terminal cleavage/methylation domain-containing protein